MIQLNKAVIYKSYGRHSYLNTTKISDSFFRTFITTSLFSNIYVQIIILYSIGLSALYLGFYWNFFSIDILPFVTVSDIIKFSAYPLIIIFTSLAFFHTFLGLLLSYYKDFFSRITNKAFERFSMAAALLCYFIGDFIGSQTLINMPIVFAFGCVFARYNNFLLISDKLVQILLF